MAEREGFEPSVPLLGGTHDFQSCTFDQLGHLSTSILWRRERDSNSRGEKFAHSLSRRALSTTQPSLRTYSLKVLKKFSKSILHSSSIMPKYTSVLLPKSGLFKRFMTVPAAPDLSLSVPIYTLFIRASKIAPAHIGQGSKVTYMLQSSNLQLPRVLQASFIAIISA